MKRPDAGALTRLASLRTSLTGTPEPDVRRLLELPAPTEPADASRAEECLVCAALAAGLTLPRAHLAAAVRTSLARRRKGTHMFDKMKSSAESYGVIGLGRFGTALVKTLSDAGKEVIAVDKDEAKVKAVRGWTDYAFVIDELNEAALKETGMQNCGTVTICIGEQIDISILTTMLVTKLGVPHVISKAASEVHGEVLKRLGAEVVYPEADMAVRIGKRLISGNLLDYIALGDGVEVRRITVGGRMLGKSVRTLDLRKAYGINIIAVEHGQQTNVEFSADYTFKEGDTVAVIGKVGKIDKFEREM